MTATLIAPPGRLFALFRQLADQWKGETRYLSSTTAICTHPAYQRIIGLGPQSSRSSWPNSPANPCSGSGRCGR